MLFYNWFYSTWKELKRLIIKWLKLSNSKRMKNHEITKPSGFVNFKYPFELVEGMRCFLEEKPSSLFVCLLP